MSKKRPTESSWDSDEELLNDTSGNAITAFPKISELELLGDDGELDEDALLGTDDAGMKSSSFGHDSVWPAVNRQRSKASVSHQDDVAHEEQVVDEQAFIFEETDTADLEDELNVGGQEGSETGYHVGDVYESGLYHEGAGNEASQGLTSGHDHQHVGYTSSRLSTSESGDMGYMLSRTEHASYDDDERGAEFSDSTGVGYIEDAANEGQEDMSAVELGYEEPVEQDEQVHLEYEDSHAEEKHGHEESKAPHYETESDSDDENSHHSRGKFTSERTGVISLTPATTREAIPDTLEINEEQAAQIEQFMSDKSQKGKGQPKSRGHTNARSRLGARRGKMPQQNQKTIQNSRMAPFLRGMLDQQLPMGFAFRGALQNRGLFPSGVLSLQGPFPARILNPRRSFPGMHNERQVFPMRSGDPRGSYPISPLNMLIGGPQRGPFPRTLQERFPGGPNRMPFPRGPQPSQRMPQQNIRSPQTGLIRGPPPNHIRPQGSFQQRITNPAQFGQRSPQMGQQMRAHMANPAISGPRPLMEQPGPGMRFPAAVHPLVAVQHHEPIPPLLNSGNTPPLGQQQLKPGQQMPSAARRISPHQRLGPVQGQSRLQNPGQSQGPRFMLRMPFQGNQPPMDGQGDIQGVRKHKIYINPRFQDQQVIDGAEPGQSRTVKMGVPIQQKKAKLLLERAIQTQNKQVSPVQVTVAGVKRKSTSNDNVPNKVVVKSGDSLSLMKSDTEPVRVVQAGNASTNEDPQKMKALLDEQKRQRELIQKRKELARQKQAAVKRKELEQKLKEEGKTIEDIMGTKKAPSMTEQADQQVATPMKQISGSVASRLGPPPTQELIRGPPPTQELIRGPPPHLHGHPQGPPPNLYEAPQGPPPAGYGHPPPGHGQPQGPPPQRYGHPQAAPPQGQVNPQGPPPGYRHPQAPPPQGQVNPQAPLPGYVHPQGPPPPSYGHPPGPTLVRMRQPTHQGAVKIPQVPRTPQQLQVRAPVQASPFPSQPRIAGPADPRMRGPQAGNDPRFRGPPPAGVNVRPRGPPPATDARFQVPSTGSQFRGPPPNPDPRYRAPQATPNNRFSVPPPSTDTRFTAPPPMTVRIRNPSAQAASQRPPVPSQTIRYTVPPPASTQSVRFMPPHSAPPQASSQVSPPQQFQPQYPPPRAPASAPASQPSTQYLPPDQRQTTAYISSVTQTTSYELPPTYPPSTQSQYQPQPHYQPPTSQVYARSPSAQYSVSSPDPYQTTAQHYQTSQPAYLTSPPKSQYQPAPLQSHYQPDPLQSQYQASPDPHYQAPATQQYRSVEYSTPPDQHYQQTSYSSYDEPQPIQTVTSQVTTLSVAGDQRTVQHQTPVGQRIQTIGQRVQPVTGTQMRSIIHNLALQTTHVEESAPARLVQPRTTGTKVMTDGQVQVLEGPQKILIQNLPQMATKETLIKICRHFGQVLGVNLMPEQNKAVVQFQKGEQAAKCVNKCNQKCLHKTRLTVKLLPS